MLLCYVIFMLKRYMKFFKQLLIFKMPLNKVARHPGEQTGYLRLASHNFRQD